jgi:hypothetical protein
MKLTETKLPSLKLEAGETDKIFFECLPTKSIAINIMGSRGPSHKALQAAASAGARQHQPGAHCDAATRDRQGARPRGGRPGPVKPLDILRLGDRGGHLRD